MNDAATASSKMDILKVEVLEAMREIKARAEAVRAALVNESGYAWVWRDPNIERPATESDCAYAAWALTETDYVTDEQKPQDTLCAPGLITASPQTRIRIDQLNAAREKFRGLCAELKNAKIKVDGKHERLVTYWLRNHGFGRINRRQTYRHIAILGFDEENREQPIAKIAFSWCAPSRMQLLTREQLRVLIQTGAKSDEAIEHHLAQLDSIPDREFAQVREAALPQPRANVWLVDEKQPVMATSPMPIVIPAEHPLPRVKPIGEQRKSPTRERQWSKLIEEPFIGELHIHRYRKYLH